MQVTKMGSDQYVPSQLPERRNSQEKKNEPERPLVISEQVMVPNSSKYLLNGGELKIDLRTESGLMTGRRTLFFLEANWPAEILQQKETQDVKIFYYPGTRNVDWEPDDPTKLWLTEEYFPGTNVYLEVQCWSQNGDKMQFISKCNKHGNIIKIANPTHVKSKDVSDNTVNWKGTSLPKIAICFCCTPSCFKKLDPFMFIRMRFGQMVYQSQWFQLVFRKSTKRKRDSITSLKGDDVPPSKSAREGEELAIAELTNFSATHAPERSSSRDMTSTERILNRDPLVQTHSPGSSPQSPFGTIPLGSPAHPSQSLAPLSALRNASSRHNSLNTSQMNRISDIQQLLCGDHDVARSLLKLDEKPTYRSFNQSSILQEQWEELERNIIEIRSKYGDGSNYCINLIRSLTLHVKDYDSAKESFLRWLKMDHGISHAETLETVLSIIHEPWFHGQPTSSEFEKRLLSYAAMMLAFDTRPYSVRISTDEPVLILDLVKDDRKNILSEPIRMEKAGGNIHFRFTSHGLSNFGSARSIHELLFKSSLVTSSCVPLPKTR